MTALAKAPKRIHAIGRRKTSVARVFLQAGDGKFTINERDLPTYFAREPYQRIVVQPFEATGTQGKYDVEATITGGGLTGQADALKHGIARALLLSNGEFRKPLRNFGLLTRDAREVERKKYGHRGARRRPQYSKR